jgi:hypothetical protein
MGHTMFTLFVCGVLVTAMAEDLCQTRYGHPGNLGVTKAAEQYFKANTSYDEIAATIGVPGKQVPSKDGNSKVYTWQSGQLEMHFRNDRLTMYRMDRRWNIISNPTPVLIKEHSSADQARVNANLRRSYEAYYNQLSKIVEAGRRVAVGQEQADIRVLESYSARLRRAIDEGNWKMAQDIQHKLNNSPASKRSHQIAADAKRRIAARKWATEERRHREEMEQRERIHRNEMHQQQMILNELRNR